MRRLVKRRVGVPHCSAAFVVSLTSISPEVVFLRDKNKPCEKVSDGGLVLLNSIVQSLVLPHVDLTLISCNAATAILTNMILSTKVLGEQFIWQYDLTAMFFIAIGTITIVV